MKLQELIIKSRYNLQRIDNLAVTLQNRYVILYILDIFICIYISCTHSEYKNRKYHTRFGKAKVSSTSNGTHLPLFYATKRLYDFNLELLHTPTLGYTSPRNWIYYGF